MFAFVQMQVSLLSRVFVDRFRTVLYCVDVYNGTWKALKYLK